MAAKFAQPIARHDPGSAACGLLTHAGPSSTDEPLLPLGNAIVALVSYEVADRLSGPPAVVHAYPLLGGGSMVRIAMKLQAV